jgi:hypothetical protein
MTFVCQGMMPRLILSHIRHNLSLCVYNTKAVLFHTILGGPIL